MNRVPRGVNLAGLSVGLSTGTSAFICKADCGMLRRTDRGGWTVSPSWVTHVGGFFARSFCIARSLEKELICDLGMIEVGVEVQTLVGGPGGVRSANMMAMVP